MCLTQSVQLCNITLYRTSWNTCCSPMTASHSYQHCTVGEATSVLVLFVSLSHCENTNTFASLYAFVITKVQMTVGMLQIKHIKSNQIKSNQFSGNLLLALSVNGALSNHEHDVGVPLQKFGGTRQLTCTDNVRANVYISPAALLHRFKAQARVIVFAMVSMGGATTLVNMLLYSMSM